MAPQPNVQGDPPKFPNPPRRPPINENVDTVDDLNPAELARLFEEWDRFQRLTAGRNSGRRSELPEHFDTSTIYGMMLVIIVAVTIYGLTHLLVATFRGFRYD